MAEPGAVHAEVRQWLDTLRAGTASRRQAAAELSRLGVWARGSVRTRGSLGRAAQNRLPEPGRLDEILGCLADADHEVRARVAVALGEWGGPKAAEALARMLETETDDRVRLHAVTGLRLIGGPAATEALRRLVETGGEGIRVAALSAIEELITGGRRDDTEAPDPPSTVWRSAEQPGGPAIRTRGATRVQGPAPPADDQLADTLQRVRADTATSTHVRHHAAEVLRYLQARPDR
jgi:hypothetical protein